MREFCAGHGCSPGSSGRKWQGGGGHTFEGSPSSPMFSGSLGSVCSDLDCARVVTSNGLCNRAGNMLFSWCFRACLVEGFAVD